LVYTLSSACVYRMLHILPLACDPLCLHPCHFHRFQTIDKEMKLLKGSSFLDYLKPFRDTQDALFRLLSYMKMEWIPESSTRWELSKSDYADTSLTELSESVLSCPICLDISSLGLYYQCTHECCNRCVQRNEQKLCGQCRKPPRSSGNNPTPADDARLHQFNGVIEKLMYCCPCGRKSCQSTAFADAHNSQCPYRFSCPLAGDDCSFRAGVGQEGTDILHAHLTQCHPMEDLWDKYILEMIDKKIEENIVDPWIDTNKLAVVLGAAHGCVIPVQAVVGTTP
jgi:hypothetical protein